jgi:hypothetical protein
VNAPDRFVPEVPSFILLYTLSIVYIALAESVGAAGSFNVPQRPTPANATIISTSTNAIQIPAFENRSITPHCHPETFLAHPSPSLSRQT